MKRRLYIFLLLMLLCTKATAHDIAVANSDGVTIYYIWIKNHTELAVSYGGDDVGSFDNEYIGSVVIPSTVSYSGKTYSVTSIANSAFFGCSDLTSVSIPSSVTSIGKTAFSYCSGLTSVLIPSSVTSIGGAAFSRCSGLTSVTIQEGVTNIGNLAFFLCSGLTTVTIPSSVTSIGGAAFSDCSGLTSVTIPSSVTSIGDGAFYGTAWFNNQPDGLVYAGKVAYRYKGTMPSNTSITLRNGTLGIAVSAFSYCTGLTSVTIPSSVTSFGHYAFVNCSGLTSVIVESITPVAIDDEVFSLYDSYDSAASGISSFTRATLYVPYGCKVAYQATDGWKEFNAIKEYPDHDVNQDGTVNVVDVVDIARYVVATPAQSFDVFLADLNSDKTVNVADAVVLVNDIAGETSWSRRMQTPVQAPDDMLALTENDDHSLSLLLEGSGRYTAFQFDLSLPVDVDVAQMCLNSLRKQHHQLFYNKVCEGTWRVVALSTSNREFEGTSGELLNLVLDGCATDGVRIDNIRFVTAQGIDVPFAAISLNKDGTATGIAHTTASTAREQKVFNMNGQRLGAPRKGLNIVNGKKVVMK